MSQPIEDKDKKIADLRSLLTQAKTKIEQYKAQLHLKEKQTKQVKDQYEKKIKIFEADSENIIRQYEQRLLRYQKTLQESNQLIEKHQKGMQYASKNYQQLLKKIGSIYSITNKTFSLAASKEKENTDAVQELCQLEKCKEFLESLEKFNEISDLDVISKMLSLVVKNTKLSLEKRREQRIQFVKKETILQKSIEEEKNRVSKMHLEVESLRKQLVDTRDRYEKTIESINKSKLKMQEEKTNEQFIKQLMIKLMLGPKDATVMAFGILSKVLKMSEDQIKLCEKKIK